MAVKPLNEEQKRDAARLRAIFWKRQSENPSLTQESLAHACDWKTQGAVNQYLLGKIPLNLRALMKFSAALDIPPSGISPTLANQISHAVEQTLAEYEVVETEKLAPDEVELLAAYRATRIEGKINTLFTAKTNAKAYPAGLGTSVNLGAAQAG